MIDFSQVNKVEYGSKEVVKIQDVNNRVLWEKQAPAPSYISFTGATFNRDPNFGYYITLATAPVVSRAKTQFSCDIKFEKGADYDDFTIMWSVLYMCFINGGLEIYRGQYDVELSGGDEPTFGDYETKSATVAKANMTAGAINDLVINGLTDIFIEEGSQEIVFSIEDENTIKLTYNDEDSGKEVFKIYITNVEIKLV